MLASMSVDAIGTNWLMAHVNAAPCMKYPDPKREGNPIKVRRGILMKFAEEFHNTSFLGLNRWPGRPQAYEISSTNRRANSNTEKIYEFYI